MLILNHKQIDRKIKRIAYQIVEFNLYEKELVVLGISKNGYILANDIVKQLRNIYNFNINVGDIEIDKRDVFSSPIKISVNEKDFKNKSVVVVDDVINTGKTLIYAIKNILNIPIKNISSVVLVDRSHKQYPIKANFKGLQLSTSIKQNVRVILDKNNYRAILD